MALLQRPSDIRVDLPFLELNQVLAAVQVRSVLLEQFIADTTDPETRTYLRDALISCRLAEGRLSVALMGDPDLALGDHFAYPDAALGIGREL